ncbi:MAG TPA: hypothetical protein VMX33_12755 [bacterium]|nr:hypothetical protein [bacterium]
MNIGAAALAVRFGVMAVTTFLAIIVWSRIRDLAWMLIVVGIIAGYADILYSLLVVYGLVPDAARSAGAAGLLAYVFPNVPWLFFSLAFIVMIRRRRPRG